VFRILGVVAIAGAFAWVSYQTYIWYESRHPAQAVAQVSEPQQKPQPTRRPVSSGVAAVFQKFEGADQQAAGIEPAQTTVSVGAVYYSPWQNLEAIDSSAILHSRCNHLDLAMYSFTDYALAQAVAAFANSGRPVRIYRDREQYEQEQDRGSRVRDVLRVRNIQIRVKKSMVLMHQKAWSDGCVFREGSANWSPAGEKQQDNTLTFLNDPASINNYERAFEAMWDRGDNLVVQ
jgi:phosphatidylserine/phosphatidylglycerophosphate/cardiolipin synthase-like enzyme